MNSTLYQLSYEVTPAYAPRIEPPRGLEPRPPHYERGVLPVELWRQGVRTVGIEPTTPGWKPGMFPLHHIHVERASTRSEAGTAVSSFERPQSEVAQLFASPAAEPAGVEPATYRASTGRSSP